MLQATEYDLGDYLAWFHRAPNIAHVERRGHLVLTAKARLLLGLVWFIVATSLVSALGAALRGLTGSGLAWFLLTAAILALLPLLAAYLLAIPLWLGEQIVQKPRAKAIIARAATTLANHPARRIAIAGSYGKTTAKEILLSVLSAGRTVAATPGNMNTPLGISRFASRLTGKEDILILELGEYYPGDIRELCELTKPHLGVITGINEAHLSKFKTLEATTATIFELADYLGEAPVYKNGENALVAARARSDDPLLYTRAGVNGWKVSAIEIAIDHTSFTARRGSTTIRARSGLLGAHNLGPLVAAIDIATELGLTPTQIEAGLADTKPYEHRMQPRLQHGATIVDDTYNGNVDGVRAGLDWLAAVPATRRVYITPGLVEQGNRTAQVHEAIGGLIAAALTSPTDLVVLMRNTTTPHVEKGLQEAKFAGRLQIVDDPLKFYSNLEQFVAAGDVVLMQNDWTDNYS